MSLFKKLHNEALDEDLKAQRQVIENLKKQVNIFSNITLVKPSIGVNEKYTLNRYINSFIEALNNFAGAQREGETRAIEFSASTLMSRYNSLALYLSNLGLKSLNENDKIQIVGQLDDLLPLIKNVQRITSNLESVFDRKIVDDIAMNFENQLYRPIGINLGQKALSVKNQKIKADIAVALDSAKEALASGNDLLSYDLAPDDATSLRQSLDKLPPTIKRLEDTLRSGEIGSLTKAVIAGLKKNVQAVKTIIDSYDFEQ
jgi:hypothetical protein